MGYRDGNNMFDIARVQLGVITQMKDNVIPFMICPLWFFVKLVKQLVRS